MPVPTRCELNFFSGTKRAVCALQVLNEFPNVMTQQSSHADYVYLLEAVSAVLGAQREPKVDLLEESSSSSKDATPSHLQVSANRGERRKVGGTFDGACHYTAFVPPTQGS